MALDRSGTGSRGPRADRVADKNFDLSLQKSIPITESKRFEFRGPVDPPLEDLLHLSTQMDAVQETFLRAFEHFGEFQGRSKFVTWLMRIAHNVGIERLRQRHSLGSLDDWLVDAEERFAPRQVQAWQENPEQMYAGAEIRVLVEREVRKLPMKYCVVLILRDIEQLPSEEVAATLGMTIPGLKARLLRGRLMLREALSPYFTKNMTISTRA
jgi:RNA polymerase sigma-70 factor (ECF subfamily)